MQLNRQLLYLSAVIALGLMMILGVFIAINGASAKKASAMDPSELDRVRDYLDSYISSQYQADTFDGESGFLIDAPTLKSLTDSNDDGIYLGEGDDAAGAPILVDVLNGGAGGIIQGTSVISSWNSTTTNGANTSLIASKVAGHELAGFSTDIVSYCLTGHTESVAAGAMGAISQAGGYGGTAPPRVLALKWGRFGWNIGTHNYGASYDLTGPSPNTCYPLAGNSACAGAAPDSELVRCVANWALSSSGGNVGSGYEMNQNEYFQVVDLRPGPLPDWSTIQSSVETVQIPLNTLFNSGLCGLNPSNPPTGPKKLFANRTQHTAGIAAVGAEMLGYDSTFLKWGLANYNLYIGEQYTGGMGYGLVAPVIDNTAPTITGSPAGTAMGLADAGITWTTDEPATSMVQISTTPGGPYAASSNDTVLHAAHDVTLTSLTPDTTYYAVVTSCDGQANCTVSSEISWTQPPCGRPDLDLSISDVYWNSMADYNSGVLSIDFDVVSFFDIGDIDLEGLISTNNVETLSPMPMTMNHTGPGAWEATVRLQVPAGVTAFVTSVFATAQDACGNVYSYPAI